MPLSRAGAETDLVAKIGASLLARCGMSNSHAGANADLNGPLFRALERFGYTVADPSSVTDADMAQVQPAQYVKFLDQAMLETIDVCTIHLAGAPTRVDWVDFQSEYDTAAATLAAIKKGLDVDNATAILYTTPPAAGQYDRASCNHLSSRPYFRPWTYGGWPGPWR